MSGARCSSGPPTDGVDNGARTRDLLDHNQALYQLSYIHQETAPPVRTGRAGKKCSGTTARAPTGVTPTRPRAVVPSAQPSRTRRTIASANASSAPG